ncbi:hypothetical protein C8J57DRAFT_1241027 [Mycena rebaudengoi]|nr:hypothetical protein C8J57DRAFT_1241027 [Mycena rebaudengoi]
MKGFISVLATATVLLAVGHISASPVNTTTVANTTATDTNRLTIRCADPSAATDLFRLYHPNDNGDHFYTTDREERRRALRSGYTAEGVTGRVFTSQRDSPALVPLYRLYNPRSGDHFYTTSIAERNAARQYAKEGIAGYIYPSRICDSVTLYRLYNNQDHFYTTDGQEVIDARRAGYRSEGQGFAGFILPAN